MASASTTNRGVPYPLETDNPDVAGDLHQLATYIDSNNAKSTSGTSLPASGMTVGDEFRLTTTNTWYKYDGTSWNVLERGVNDWSTSVSTPARAAGTAYQPNTTRPTFVTAVVQSSSQVTLNIGPTSSPSTLVGKSSSPSGSSVCALVPPGWYYEIVGTGVTITVSELTL